MRKRGREMTTKKKRKNSERERWRKKQTETVRQTDRQRCRERNKSHPLVVVSSSNGKDLRPGGKGFWDGVLVDSWTKPWAVWVAVNSDGDVGNVGDIRSGRVVHCQTQLSKEDTANSHSRLLSLIHQPNIGGHQAPHHHSRKRGQKHEVQTLGWLSVTSTGSLEHGSRHGNWQFDCCTLGYYCVVLKEQKTAPKGCCECLSWGTPAVTLTASNLTMTLASNWVECGVFQLCHLDFVPQKTCNTWTGK